METRSLMDIRLSVISSIGWIIIYAKESVMKRMKVAPQILNILSRANLRF